MQTRLPDAQKELETAISLDPNNAPAYFHLGETLLYLGQPEAGLQALEKAIQLDRNAATHFGVGGGVNTGGDELRPGSREFDRPRRQTAIRWAIPAPAFSSALPPPLSPSGGIKRTSPIRLPTPRAGLAYGSLTWSVRPPAYASRAIPSTTTTVWVLTWGEVTHALPTVALANHSAGHVRPARTPEELPGTRNVQFLTSRFITGSFSEATEQNATLTLDFYANSTGSSDLRPDG